MILSELYSYINSFADFSTQESWDNSGLIAGDMNSEITGILTCLDVTAYEIELAKKNGCNVIVSHHPIIFRAVKNVLKGSPVFEAVSNGISVISAHTSLDKAVGGVNDSLCDLIEMNYEKQGSDTANGFLNIGTVENCDTPEKLASHISQKLGAAVRFAAASDKISKIAVCSGAGADFAENAADLGCDAFITGDAGYHDFLEAAAVGVSLFAAGHYETENQVGKVLAKIIGSEYPELHITVSDRVNPIKTVI